MNRATEEELFELLGQPEMVPLERLDGKILDPGVPPYIVRSSHWPEWPHDNDYDDEDVKVLDLEAWFYKDAVPDKLPQPQDLNAPEITFTGKFDYRVDLWCTGMTVSSYCPLEAAYVPIFDQNRANTHISYTI